MGSRHFPEARDTYPLCFSPQAHLLPYLDQLPLSDLVDSPPHQSSRGGDDLKGINAIPAVVSVAVFNGPADVGAVLGGAGATPGVVFGGTNYSSCVGPGASSSGVFNGDYVTGDGVFLLPPGGPVKMLQITDGTSSTAAFSESVYGNGMAGLSPSPGVLDPLAVAIDISGAAMDPVTCAGTTTYTGQRGDRWINGGYLSTAYNHYYQPNSTTLSCLGSSIQLSFEGGTAAGIPAASISFSATATSSSSPTVSACPPGKPWRPALPRQRSRHGDY